MCRASFGAEAVQYSPRHWTGADEASTGPVDSGEGFYMEYVIHPAERAENSQLTSGPHVMEVIANGVHLQWNQMLQLDLLWQLSQVYSSYTYAPWVSPYREVGAAMLACNLAGFSQMRMLHKTSATNAQSILLRTLRQTTDARVL